jgi:hypothetical protein
LAGVDLTVLALSVLSIVDVSLPRICVLGLAHFAALCPFYKKAKVPGLIELSMPRIEEDVKRVREDLQQVHADVHVALRQDIRQSQTQEMRSLLQVAVLGPALTGIEGEFMKTAESGKELPTVVQALTELSRLARLSSQERQDQGLSDDDWIANMLAQAKVLAAHKVGTADALSRVLQSWKGSERCY